jgi:two-component system catabolic regulation response regulator CreB
MSTRLLLLEDDPAIARTVAYALERDGLQVTHCLLVQDARQQMQRHPFDLLVLDVGLPDGNGLDLLRDVRHGQAAAALRLRQATPVLMLSARGEELDRVLGLELGADDYLAKPFSPRELAARIKALLRRAACLRPPPWPPRLL